VQLDPAVITDGISSRLTRQLYDGLVKYRGATTEVEPALAEKWACSATGRATRSIHDWAAAERGCRSAGRAPCLQ
jgi:ABC-type oligopeptide transport system substrate-binding subunit